MTKTITTITLSMTLLLVLSAVGLGLILNKLDPSQKTWNIMLLYIDMFVLVYSLSFLFGFAARRIYGARELAPKHVVISSRQSIWFGLLVVVSLFLLSIQFLTWWNASLLILCLTFLESYFLFK